MSPNRGQKQQVKKLFYQLDQQILNRRKCHNLSGTNLYQSVRMESKSSQARSFESIVSQQMQDALVLQQGVLLQMEVIQADRALKQSLRNKFGRLREELTSVKAQFCCFARLLSQLSQCKTILSELTAAEMRKSRVSSKYELLQQQLAQRDCIIFNLEESNRNLKSRLASVALSEEVFRVMQKKMQEKDEIIGGLQRELQQSQTQYTRQSVILRSLESHNQSLENQIRNLEVRSSMEQSRQHQSTCSLGQDRVLAQRPFCHNVVVKAIQPKYQKRTILKEILDDTLKDQDEQLKIIEEQKPQPSSNEESIDKQNICRESVYQQSLKQHIFKRSVSNGRLAKKQLDKSTDGKFKKNVVRAPSQSSQRKKEQLPKNQTKGASPGTKYRKGGIQPGQLYERLLRKQTKYDRLIQSVLRGKDARRRSIQLN